MVSGATQWWDGSGYFHVGGEVRNTTGSSIQFTQIVGTFYNSAQTVISVASTYAELDIIAAGETSPFDLTSYPDKIQPYSYNLDIQYRSTSQQPLGGLIMGSVSASFDSSGYYRLVGEVMNTSSVGVKFVEVIATFYNDGGAVIGVAYTFTQLDQISPGSKSPFTLSSYPQKITPAKYKLQIQGHLVS